MAVTLDNIKAMLSRDRGEKDLASSQCVFAQAYRQLTDTDPKLLRTVWDGERVFQVSRKRTPIGQAFTTTTAVQVLIAIARPITRPFSQHRSVLNNFQSTNVLPVNHRTPRVVLVSRLGRVVYPAVMLVQQGSSEVCFAENMPDFFLVVPDRSILWERTEWTRVACFVRACLAWWKTFFRRIWTS